MSKVVAVPPTQDMDNCCAPLFAEKFNCVGTRRAEGTDGEKNSMTLITVKDLEHALNVQK